MKVCIVVPVTREWGVDVMVDNLARLLYSNYEVSLLVYVDSNDPQLMAKVEAANYPKSIHRVQFLASGNQPTMENKVAYRRNRIVAMKQDTAKHLHDCDFVFSFEDDTVLPENALVTLVDLVKDNPNIGFAQGIQCGRWDLPMLGCWEVDNVYSPTSIKTVTLKEGQHKMDAGGFYCYATLGRLYREAEYSWHDECFGPDVMFGLGLRQKGYTLLTDYSILCGHTIVGKELRTIYPTGREIELEWRLKKGQWMRQFTYLDLKNRAK